MRPINHTYRAGLRPSQTVQNSLHLKPSSPALFHFSDINLSHKGRLDVIQGAAHLLCVANIFAAEIARNSIRRRTVVACAATDKHSIPHASKAASVAPRKSRVNRCCPETDRASGFGEVGAGFLRRQRAGGRTVTGRGAIACSTATHYSSPSAAVNIPPITCSDGCRCAWHPEGVGVEV